MVSSWPATSLGPSSRKPQLAKDHSLGKREKPSSRLGHQCPLPAGCWLEECFERHGHTLSQRKKGIRTPVWHVGSPHLEAGGPGVKTLLAR